MKVHLLLIALLLTATLYSMGLFDTFFGRQKTPSPPPSSRLSELAALFPFPVHNCPGASVEQRLLSLRAALPPDAASAPVIVGEYDSAARMTDMWDEPYDLDEQLKRAQSCSVAEWLNARRAEAGEEDGETEQSVVHPEGTTPMTSLTVGMHHSGRPHDEVFIADVPISDFTLLPIHLRFGDWNDCPSPYVHAAFARHWKERYGAEIVTVAGDIIEYTVARKPATAKEALDLAWEQYLYCPDIVDQGVGSVATLAKALEGSSRWYFWWD